MCSIVGEQAFGSTVVNEKANTLSDTLANKVPQADAERRGYKVVAAQGQEQVATLANT